jgi:predicted enzyme related to lactoylglutathione lyase
MAEHPAADPATASLFRVIVPVAGIDEAARFYGVLLETAGERVSEGRHYFRCGAAILACVVPGGHGADPTLRPLPDYCYFSVADLEAALERARAAGATIEREIDSYPWGERSFYFRDPFGNPLCFVDERSAFIGGDFVP